MDSDGNIEPLGPLHTSLIETHDLNVKMSVAFLTTSLH